MLIWQRLKNFCEMAGYARAASQLATQGHYAEAEKLMLEKAKLSNKRSAAIVRLEKWHDIQSSYDPARHYMRGKTVATWKGKAA